MHTTKNVHLISVQSWTYLLTGSKIEIDKCILLGSLRTHVGAKQIFVKLFITFSVY